MATLKEIIDYSKANPESDYAKQAYDHIVSGGFDEQAGKEGVDLSPFGRPKPPETGLRKVGEVAKDVAIGAGKGLANTLQTVASPITNVMEKVSGQEMGIADEKLIPTNTAQKIGKGVEQVAEFMIPATKVAKLTSGVGRLGKIAGQVASDVAVETAQGGEDVGKTATISATLSSLPFMSSLLGKYSKIGEGASKIAQNLEKTSLRLTPVQRQQLEKSGDDVIKFITENKIVGTPEKRFDKISEMYEGMEETVQNTLKSSGEKYSKDEFVNLVKSVPERYSTSFDNPEVYNQLVRLSDELVKYADNFKGEIPIEKINALKRAYMKNAFNKMGDQVTNEARLAMGETLYKDILETIPTLRGVNKEYQKVLQAKKLLGKAIGRNELGLIGNMVSMSAGAGLGAGIGGPVGAAIGAGVGPTIATKLAGTESRSLIGANLQKLSDYVKNIKPDQAGNLIIPKSILQGLTFEADQSSPE